MADRRVTLTAVELHRLLYGSPPAGLVVKYPGQPRDSHGRFGAGKLGGAEHIAAEIARTGRHSGAWRRPGDPVGESRALLAAYQAGHRRIGHLSGGLSGGVDLIHLSDGSLAVSKSHPDHDEALGEHLAGVTAAALGIRGVNTAMPDRLTTIAPFLPGVTAREAAEAAGVTAFGDDAVAALAGRKNGRETGLLDWLTGQADRNSGNWLVDGDTIWPVDQSQAYFEDATEWNSPLARHWLSSGLPVRGRPPALKSPFTPGELAAHREALEELEGEFDARGAADRYGYMMDKFTRLEAAARR